MYFEIDAHRRYLVLENVGKSIAEEVKIKFEPELKNSKGEKYNELKKISYLPPNYKIKTFLIWHITTKKFKSLICL